MKRRLNIYFLLAIEILLFAVTEILALLAAWRWSGLGLAREQVVVGAGGGMFSMGQIGAVEFLVVFLLATLIFYLALRFLRGAGFFNFLLFFAILVGSGVILFAFFSTLVALVLLAIVLALFWRVREVWVFDLVMVLSLAGIAVDVGLRITPLSAMVILVILAWYDFWAVYCTKHMIKMFQGLVKRQVILALVIPARFTDFRSKLVRVASDKNFMFLGGGDLVLSLLLAVAVLRLSWISGVSVASGALVGAVFTFWLALRERRLKKAAVPLPALPPIAFFSVLGYLVSWWF